MTLGYIQHKYLTVTRKTRKDTLLQILLIFTLYFCVYIQSKGVFPHWYNLDMCSQTRMQKWPKLDLTYLCEFCELRWDICAGYSLGSLLLALRKILGWGAPRWHTQKFRRILPKITISGPKWKPTNVPCGCTYCTPKSRAEKDFTIPSKSCKNFESKNLTFFDHFTEGIPL